LEEELECHRKEKQTVEDKLANVGKQENPIVEKISFEEPPNSEEKLTWAEEDSDNIEDTKISEQQLTFDVNLVVDEFTSNDSQKEENTKVSSDVGIEVLGDAQEKDKRIHDKVTNCSEASDTIEEDELLKHSDTNDQTENGQITKPFLNNPSSDSFTHTIMGPDEDSSQPESSYQMLPEGYPELLATAMVIFISLLWLNC